MNILNKPSVSVTSRVVMLVDNSYSIRMVSAFDRIAESINLAYKIIPYNISKLGALTTAKIGKSGNALKTQVADETRRADFNRLLDRLADLYKTKIFIVACEPANYMISGYKSLEVTRGSRYDYNGYVCFVIDKLDKPYTVNYGRWVAQQDLLKVNRYVNGKVRQFPKFRYKVARRVEDLAEFVNETKSALFTACDIETSGSPTMISCIAYTCAFADGRWTSYVIPLVNTTKEGNAHWDSLAEEVKAWEAIRAINANSATRFIFHNGQYDGSYLVRYTVPTTNYLWDTEHMWHSLYCELPKSLKFVTSFASDYYRYWKDEISGGEEDDKGSKDKSKIPTSREGIERYWRYNALDTYNTMCCFIYQIVLFKQIGYAIKNYSTEFALQMEYLLIGYKGFRTLRSRLDQIVASKFEIARKELNRLRYWIGEPEFNPSSSAQKSQLFYDLLGCKPVKIHGKETKSTDKQALGQLQYQHPLFKRFVDQLHRITIPNKFITDFSNCKLDNGRMLYSLNAAGTNTSRASSSASPFWIGRNMQNISPDVRESMVADEGYILFDIDYSQSDNYFVAYESEDPKCIEVVRDPRDTHCIHTAHFFKMSYEDVYNDPHKKAKDSPRSCTKKIVHGCNYSMQGRTMFINICAELGKEALFKAASLLGYEEPWSLSDSKLIEVCDKLRESYFQLYPHLATWDKRLVEECMKSGGTLATAFGFTRRFFGNYTTDNAIQRQMSSLKGQGGTGGNINRAIYQYYYGRGDGKPSLYQRGMFLLLQVHDSLVGQVPLGKMSLLDELIDIMEQPITIKGREMYVPVEADVGFTWSKSMKGYTKGDGAKHLAELVEYENTKYRAKFGEKPLVLPANIQIG